MKTKEDVAVPARYYLRLGSILKSQGVDILKIAAGIGLPARKLQEADALLPFSRVERLIDAVQNATGRSDLGFELGKLLSVSAHSIVGFGMLSAPDLDRALRFASRYFGLVMPTFQLRYSLQAGFTEMHFTPRVAMSHNCLAFHLEAMAMACLRDVREVTSDVNSPCWMQISIPPPPHAKRYASVKDVKVEFGSDWGFGTRLRFSAELAFRNLTMADPNALNMADLRCRALVDRVANIRQFGEWIAMTLREVGDGHSTQPEIARMLNISERSLSRFLHREGTSFREISRKVMHELARERLKTPMTITEVAYSLGFSDTANFTRAFRGVEGLTPSEYREIKASKASKASRKS